MEEIRINETPVRTSNHFKINQMALPKVVIPEVIGTFNNIKLSCHPSCVKIDDKVSHQKLTYGLSSDLEEQVNKQANHRVRFLVDSKMEGEIELAYFFDQENKELVSNIEIVVNEHAKVTFYLKYHSLEQLEGYSHLVLRVQAKKQANVKVVLLNALSNHINHLVAIENKIEEEAKVDYTMIDFGGKNSVINYYANLIGKNANNQVDTMYLGSHQQFFDLNYIVHLKGENAKVNMEVQGALKDQAKKHFKGTIDFKKGAKKAIGSENESCLLLSDSARSISLPMLLCSEEEVEGNHASSAGKLEENYLFYLMSRGLTDKEAMKLMVRAKLEQVLETIPKEELKKEVLALMEQQLDA